MSGSAPNENMSSLPFWCNIRHGFTNTDQAVAPNQESVAAAGVGGVVGMGGGGNVGGKWLVRGWGVGGGASGKGGGGEGGEGVQCHSLVMSIAASHWLTGLHSAQ
ncbi:unnamed protein product, partial [Closterium sp. NIES-53]